MGALTHGQAGANSCPIATPAFRMLGLPLRRIAALTERPILPDAVPPTAGMKTQADRPIRSTLTALRDRLRLPRRVVALRHIRDAPSGSSSDISGEPCRIVANGSGRQWSGGRRVSARGRWAPLIGGFTLG